MLTLLLVSLLAEPVPIAPAKLDRKTPVDFATEIRPILQAKCLVCHAGKLTEGDYDISTMEKVIRGGKRGPAVVPGKPDDSLMLAFSAHRKKPIMPPKSEDNPLTPQEVALLERWIREGAKGTEAVRTNTIRLSVPSILPVHAVALNAAGTSAWIARGHEVRRYDTATDAGTLLVDPLVRGRLPRDASHASIVESMAISPDGQTLATGSYGEITLWDAKSGAVRHRLGGFVHQVVALAFAPDGKTLVTGGGVPSESGEVKIVDVAGGKIIRDLPTPHSDVVYGVAVRPDGSLIATASADKTAKLFDMKTGARTGNFEGHTQHVLDVVWLPDGARFATGGADGLVKIWDVAKGEKIRDIPGFGKQVMRMAVHQKNAMVAAGDGSVKSINLETGGINRTFTVGSNPVTAVSVTATGEQILAGSDDGVAKRFDVKTGKLIREWK